MTTEPATLADSVPQQARPGAARGESSSTALALLRELRPHQWLKNLLVLLPLGLAHQLGDAHKLAARL